MLLLQYLTVPQVSTCLRMPKQGQPPRICVQSGAVALKRLQSKLHDLGGLLVAYSDKLQSLVLAYVNV